MPLKGGSPQASPAHMSGANMILDLSDSESEFFNDFQAPARVSMMGGNPKSYTPEIKVIHVQDRGGSYYKPPSSKDSDYGGDEDVSGGDE